MSDDSALPFRPAPPRGQGPSPPAAAQPVAAAPAATPWAAAPAPGSGRLVARNPPRTLGSPGVLGAPAVPGAAAPPVEAPAEPPRDVTPQSPWSGAAGAAASSPPANSADEHPLAVTNSPWTTTANVAAELLPSASMLQPAAEPPPPPPPAPAPDRAGSRRAMTIGLAVAAVLLIGVVAYLTMAESRGPDDPADVSAGKEQREYDSPQAPTGATSAAATAAPQPRGPWPKAKPKPKEDIYEDL